MSSPRAATSLATSTLQLRLAKRTSTSSRSRCSMSPCRASAVKPKCFERVDHFLGVATHVAEHHADSGRCSQQQRGQRGALRARSTSKKGCSIAGLLRPRRRRVTSSGVAQHGCADLADRVGKGRREQQRLPLLRGLADDLRGSLPRNPCRACGRLRPAPACGRRPGAAPSCASAPGCGRACRRRRADRGASEASCGPSGMPPHSTSSFRLGMPVASLRSCLPTWSASSRVGHSTSAWVPDQSPGRAAAAGPGRRRRSCRCRSAPARSRRGRRGSPAGLRPGSASSACSQRIDALQQSGRQAQAGEVFIVPVMFFSHAP